MEDPAQAAQMDRTPSPLRRSPRRIRTGLGGCYTRSKPTPPKSLHGLGFHDDQIAGDVGALSGRLENARSLQPASSRPYPDVLLMDRAHQPPGHRIHHLAGAIPKVLPWRSPNDPRTTAEFMETASSPRSPKSTPAKSSPTPATTIVLRARTQPAIRETNPTKPPSRASSQC